MDEHKAIGSAFETELTNLYMVLTNSFLMAKGDAEKEKDAEQAFALGLELNRKVYKRALELIK